MKRIPALAALCDRSLEDGRAGLLRFIREGRPHGSDRNEVIVVFDGQPGIGYGPDMATDVKVVFTPGTSADDDIRRRVEEAADPRRIICVTDDRDLAISCRHRGAQVWTVMEFAGKAAPASGVRERTRDPEGKVISQTAALRIDREFAALWLRKKE